MDYNASTSQLRVALVSTGLGRVLRGFESFTDSLFNTLRASCPDLALTLFQGGGSHEEHRVVVPNFHRADIPARFLDELSALHCETRSFAMVLYPALRWGHYDIVHYNELTMGSALYHLRRIFGGSYKLLYCNGAPSPPVHYHHRCDFAQLLTPAQYKDAIEFGMPESSLFQIPYGIDSNRFNPNKRLKRSETRKAINVPEDVPLVLSVAAIKREHKRIDHLLREAAILPNVWVVVAGHRTEDTPYLESLAEELIPGRWRFVSLPHESVADLYGAADVFVLCSLSEAFGLVTIEAMLSEIPVIIHTGPVFDWLAADSCARQIDMSVPGALTSAISDSLQLFSRSDGKDALQRTREAASSRFSWEALIPTYRNMYAQATQHST